MNSVQTLEVADIFHAGFSEYCDRYGPLPAKHYAVANAIMACRTAKLGGHVDRCDHCGQEKISYNSCRDRHCPKCQALARAKWVENRIDELLPVQYFHVVFTVPQQLNEFAIRNQESFYGLFFRAVNETLQELARDPKRLGAEIGFIPILHTWGQNLMDHPHIHCVVPGGGIAKNGKKWKHCREDYLFPVQVMAALFRGKFLDYFKKAVKNGKMTLVGTLQRFTDNYAFQELLNQLYRKNWVVYAKEPFAGPQAVVKYLGRYTHRIAISNHRLVRMDEKTVTFRYKDYADNKKWKQMTVARVEFIRRFMLHVLPQGFVRIRYCGFLGNRKRQEKIVLCRKLLGQKLEAMEKNKAKPWKEIIREIAGDDPGLCPFCKKGHFVPFKEIERPFPVRHRKLAA